MFSSLSYLFVVPMLDIRTLKGKVVFNYLYDENGDKYHIVNHQSLYGYVDYGFYLIKHLTKDFWKVIRCLVTGSEELTELLRCEKWCRNPSLFSEFLLIN